MKFKVTKVEKDRVIIEYEDKSWASLSVLKGQTKAEILNQANSMAPLPTYDSVSEVPVNVGDEGDTPDSSSTTESSTTYSWHDARLANYPGNAQQLHALHKQREGDDTDIKALDVLIKAVDDKYPENSGPYKEDEL